MWLLLVSATGNAATATNAPAATNSIAEKPSTPRPEPPARKLDESAFRIIGERNIFNAERSGGRVVLPSSRPKRVESFTLVGTIAYEKGVFAFFESPSSEYAKVLKSGGIIAGHKVVNIEDKVVKLEADGKTLDLALGASMRREDEGTWQLGEAVTASEDSGSSSRSETSDRYARSNRTENGSNGSRYSRSSRNEAPSGAESDRQERKELKKEVKMETKAEADLLKRMMERREKDSQ